MQSRAPEESSATHTLGAHGTVCTGRTSTAQTVPALVCSSLATLCFLPLGMGMFTLYIASFKILFLSVYGVCMCWRLWSQCGCRSQRTTLWSSSLPLLLHGFQELNSNSPRLVQQVTFPEEPSLAISILKTCHLHFILLKLRISLESQKKLCILTSGCCCCKC